MATFLTSNEPNAGRVKRAFFFLALTAGLGGLQAVFSVQMALGSPFLLSLGFSKPLMALVWTAGPVAGMVGQPYFGLCSDQCRSSWGKRKPFIFGGAATTIVSLLFLAWTEDIVHMAAWIVGTNRDDNNVRKATLTTAALSVWALNFAIQPLQGGLRALIIESCPPDQIEVANAWASRMISTANLIVYSSGFFEIPHLLRFCSNPRFKALCLLATCGLAVATSLCLLVGEQDPNVERERGTQLKSAIEKLRYTYGGFGKLPRQVLAVCKVQFCSWVGWFFFLYYITTYLDELHTRQFQIGGFVTHHKKPADSQGLRALLCFASTQFLTSVIAPLVVRQFEKPECLLATSTPAFSSFRVQYFPTKWSALRALWMLSHALFAISMFTTFFVGSITGATILIGFAGISNALSQYVPFTLISSILSQYQADRVPPEREYTNPEDDYETRPGIVMGLHNLMIAAPQLFAACGSSAIFWLIGRNSKDRGDARGTVWVLRAGGVAALVALYMTSKLDKGMRDDSAQELRARSLAMEEVRTLLPEAELMPTDRRGRSNLP